MNEFFRVTIRNLKGFSKTLSKALALVLRLVVACLCLENCRLCKKELSLSLAYDYKKWSLQEERRDYFPSTTFERVVHTVSKIVCTESAYPAILKGVERSFFDQKYSHCLCYECFLALEIGEGMTAFFKLKNPIQSKLPIVSGSIYENKVRDLIGRFKYDGDKLLSIDLCYIMLNAWSALTERIPASNLVLAPVPLHKHRLRNRGFNQAELLARNLSLVTGIPYANALSRTVHTKPQQTLARRERLKNVSGAFKAKARAVRGKNVILVDDVCTSGATLIECAEELLKQGALSVAALTVAQAIFWESEQERQAA